MAVGDRSPRRDIPLAPSVQSDGIWSDGLDFYIIDDHDQKVHVYRPRGSGYNADRTFDLAPGNANPSGITGNGELLWVADKVAGKFFCYRQDDGTRVAAREFAADSPQGNYFDGRQMYAVNGNDVDIYAMDFTEYNENRNGWFLGPTALARTAWNNRNLAYPYPRISGKWEMFVLQNGQLRVYEDSSFSNATGILRFNPPIDSSQYLYASGNLVAALANDKVYVFDLDDADNDFTINPTASRIRAMCGFGNTLVLLNQLNNRIELRNITDGSLVTTPQFTLQGTPRGICSDDVHLFVENGSRLEAYSVADGSRNSAADLIMGEGYHGTPRFGGGVLWHGRGDQFGYPMAEVVTGYGDEVGSLVEKKVGRRITRFGYAVFDDHTLAIWYRTRRSTANIMRRVYDFNTNKVTNSEDSTIPLLADFNDLVTSIPDDDFTPSGIVHFTNSETVWLVTSITPSEGNAVAWQLRKLSYVNNVATNQYFTYETAETSRSEGLFGNRETLWLEVETVDRNNRPTSIQLVAFDHNGGRVPARDINVPVEIPAHPMLNYEAASTITGVSDYSATNARIYLNASVQVYSNTRVGMVLPMDLQGNLMVDEMLQDLVFSTRTGSNVFRSGLVLGDKLLSSRFADDYLALRRQRAAFTTTPQGTKLESFNVPNRPVAVGRDPGRGVFVLNVLQERRVLEPWRNISDTWQLDTNRIIDLDATSGSGLTQFGQHIYVETTGGVVQAYNYISRRRDAGRDFQLPFNNARPYGLWLAPDRTMYVSDTDNPRIYAYANKLRNSRLEFDLNRINARPRGIWSDGTTLWVVDAARQRAIPYDLTTGAYVPSATINLGGGIIDIWQHAEVLFLAQQQATIEIRLRRPVTSRFRTFINLTTAGYYPMGIFGHGNFLYVVNGSFAGREPAVTCYDVTWAIEGLTNTSEHIDTFGDAVPARSFKLPAINSTPTGIAGDGRYLYIADQRDDRIYAYDAGVLEGLPVWHNGQQVQKRFYGTKEVKAIYLGTRQIA